MVHVVAVGEAGVTACMVSTQHDLLFGPLSAMQHLRMYARIKVRAPYAFRNANTAHRGSAACYRREWARRRRSKLRLGDC